MRDKDKTKEQLIQELDALRQSLCTATENLNARNQDLDDVASYVMNELRGPLGIVVGFAELLAADYASFSEKELCHCLQVISQGGHTLAEMLNGLLLLANSHRLFDNVWYAAYLATMDEVSLSQWVQETTGVQEAYRFTCLPASSVPLVIRVWTMDHASSCFRAVAKLGGNRDERKVERTLQAVEWELTFEDWAVLDMAIDSTGFWIDAPSMDPLDWASMVGTGGEQWIFEGWRAGETRIRTVWNPGEEKARAAFKLGRLFVQSVPDWFALEMARVWVVDVEPEIYPNIKSQLDPDMLI